MEKKEIAYKYENFGEIIKFYFSLFDSVANPNYMDNKFAISKQPGKKFNGDIFVNMFYQMADEISENAAPFLKHRLDPVMA